jgi:alcohol dehydrogenase
VAVGGGSSIDAAKAIGVVITNGGRIEEYGTGARTITKQIPPMIAIPTTAGTGSEVSSGSVITDEQRNVKLPLGNPLMCAGVALLDPEMTLSMPPAVTAATGIDAIIHGIERYTNRKARPFTDALALGAVELGAKHLRPAYANGQDRVARDGMLTASLMGGMARTGVGLSHAISHTLGAFHDIPHGICCAVVLPAVLEFNVLANPVKYARLTEALGEPTTGLSTLGAARLVIGTVRRLMEDVGIPLGLKQLGVRESDLPMIATRTLQDYKGLAADNPRTASVMDIEAILRSSL